MRAHRSHCVLCECAFLWENSISWKCAYNCRFSSVFFSFFLSPSVAARKMRVRTKLLKRSRVKYSTQVMLIISFTTSLNCNTGDVAGDSPLVAQYRTQCLTFGIRTVHRSRVCLQCVRIVCTFRGRTVSRDRAKPAMLTSTHSMQKKTNAIERKFTFKFEMAHTKFTSSRMSTICDFVRNWFSWLIDFVLNQRGKNPRPMSSKFAQISIQMPATSQAKQHTHTQSRARAK